MKVLLISYFYHPINNAGAIRWRKFTDELQHKGHEIFVLTGPWSSQNTEHIVYLKSLGSSQNSIDAATSSASSSAKKSFFKKFLPLFLLIDGRFFWSLNVFIWLLKNLRKENLNLKIVVSGTPWSSVFFTALACRVLRREYFVDFRDFWSNEPFLNFKSKLARKYFSFLESWVLRNAKKVFTVNVPIQNFLSQKKPQKVFEIANGFAGKASWTAESFNEVQSMQKQILYAGSLSDYHGFEEFLKLVDFKNAPPLCFIGTDHTGVLKKFPIAQENPLSFSEIDQKINKQGVLLLTLGSKATHYTTAKLLSYLKAGRPILYYGPLQSPAAELIKKLDLGWVVANHDKHLLQKTMLDIRQHFENETPFSFSPQKKEIDQYSVEEISKKLETLLQSEGA